MRFKNDKLRSSDRRFEGSAKIKVYIKITVSKVTSFSVVFFFHDNTNPILFAEYIMNNFVILVL